MKHHPDVHLFLCSRCKRHVRAPVCPFCGCTEGWAPSKKTDRWARGLVIVGSAFSLACGDRTDLGELDRDASVDGATDACPDVVSVTVYGVPPKKCR